jgi:hypothetical protein
LKPIPVTLYGKTLVLSCKQTKKDRKVIPLWIKLAGIAAVLLLLFTVGNAVFNNAEEQPDQNTIVNTDDSSNTDTNNIDTDSKNEIVNPNNNAQEQESLASEKTEDNLSTEPSSKNTKVTKPINKNGITTNAVVSHNQNSTAEKSTNQQKNNPIKNVIDATKDNAVAHQAKTENDKNKAASKKTNVAINKEVIDAAIGKNKASEKVVTNTSTAENNTLTNQTETSKETGGIAKEEKEKEDTQKTALDEALAENTTKDDPADEKKERKKIKDRWKVSPSIAPVYFNTLGAGSSIHEQFNKNSKTGEVNMSYGVRGSFALNKKLSVRTGVNKVTLGYSTDDVFVLNNVTATPSDNRFALRNVDLKEDAQNTSFVSGEAFNFAQVPAVISSQIIGSIDQKLGFIEVPLEMEYELSDKKLGLRVLGGFSALFLNENEVYSTLNGDSRLIGEATNINKTSFSANLGVGLDFKLTEKFKLNLEPTFKYQLNTFNNTSGNFRPYFIGIYSGFSFKF